jgi:hypothetical protein
MDLNKVQRIAEDWLDDLETVGEAVAPYMNPKKALGVGLAGIQKVQEAMTPPERKFLDPNKPEDVLVASRTGRTVDEVNAEIGQTVQQGMDWAMMGGTIVGKGTVGKTLAETKLFRGDPTPIKLETFDPESGLKAGKELGQSMAEGPGIYFTTAKGNAKSYGKNITSANMAEGSKIIDDLEPRMSKTKISKILDSIDTQTIDNAVSNWDENPILGKKALIDAIYDNDTAKDQLMSIWSDVFHHQDPSAYMNAMAKNKIAGIQINKEGLSHFVMYDKGALKNIKAEEFLDAI